MPAAIMPGIAPLASHPMNDTPAWQRLLDAIMEACCLLAVVMLPLYFTSLTSGGYEPDKAVVLRILAAIAAAAWIGSRIAVGNAFSRIDGRNLLFWLGIALFIAYVVSTILSIDPRLSLWGSYGRQQGLWTRAAYLIFFVVAATSLRSSNAWNRLVSVILIGSLPAVIYGLAQQFGIDPIVSSGDPNTLNWPVRSSFGQHVIFASYLVMVIPFAAARAWQHRAGLTLPWRDEGPVDRSVFVLAAGVLAIVASYWVLLSLAHSSPSVFAALPFVVGGYVLLPLSRRAMAAGPSMLKVRALGYVALLSLQILVLFLSGARGAWLGLLATVPVFGFLVARRLKRPGVWRSILVVTVAAGLVLILLNIPNGPLQPLRTVHGLNRVANITDTGGAGGSGQGRILIWQGVGDLMTKQPSVGGNWGGLGRALVGYGPETMHWAFEAIYPLKLRVVTSEIWTWDRAHNIYLDYLVDVGIIGLILFAGLIVVFFRRVLRDLSGASQDMSWILVASAAAIAGHLVDGVFGLDMSTTMLLMWLLFGLAAHRGRLVEDVAESPSVPASTVATYAGAGIIFVLACIAVPLTDYPLITAALWTCGIAASVALIAGALIGGLSVNLAMPIRARVAMPAGVLFLATVLVIGSQFRFEGAAMAERTGQGLLARGNPPAALGYFQEAVNQNGYEPAYETDLGGAYASLGAARSDSAVPAYVPTPHDARTISSSLAENLGQDQLFTLGKYSLESARGLSPLDPDVYNNLGNLELYWNKPELALQQYRRAYGLSSLNPKYLDQQAMADLQASRPRIARSLAQGALQLDSTYWYSHYALSRIEDALGNRAGAKTEASLSLYWVRNFWPAPPLQDLNQMRSLAQAG